MENKELPYIEEYVKFVKEFQLGQVSGEEVGELVVRMGQYFAEWNLKLVLAERALSLVAKAAEETVDQATGKTLSSAKAQVITAASDEAFEANQCKAHLENCNQFINALKALQKGLLNEFSHMSN